MLRGISGLGLVCFFVMAWALSENRRKVPWRVVLWSVGLQAVLGVLVLRTGWGRGFFAGVKAGFDLLTEGSTAGAQFLFGSLSQVFILDHAMAPGPGGEMAPQAPFVVSAVFAFNVLPVIIFVAAVSAMLQHFGVIQAVVRGMAWLMRRTMKTSGAETFGAALLVFTGIESAAALGGYLAKMTRSELFTLQTAYMATIAASVMVAYASFGAEPGHLLAASLMSAPAAIALAKLMLPETETPETGAAAHRFEMPVESVNVFDAAARGAATGLNMALNVGALLIVFVGLIFLLDKGATALTGEKLTVILGVAFRPFAWLMGVPGPDIRTASELLATKTVFNEFLAYQQLQALIADGALSKRSIVILTYALCGFANLGSMGILIGGLSALAPERRAEIARLSLWAVISGTLASFTTACIAGILAAE